MPAFINKYSIYIYKNIYILFKTIINKRFLVFKTQDLYCHQLIICKWLNLQNPDIKMKARMKS